MNLPELAPSTSLPHTDTAGKIWKKGKHYGPETAVKRCSPKVTEKKPKTHAKRVPGDRWHRQATPGCAESRPARTPTTRGDPPAPRSRVRKWRGKHGSVPGRRGHHVQLPTTPSPLRGPPPPAPGAARGDARHQARVRKQVYLAVPLPATPESSWSRPIPQAAPTPQNPGFRKETRDEGNSRERSRQENLETATTLP